MNLTVIPCGTKVSFHNINGVIGAIEIVFTNVLYKVEYFDKDMNYKFVWAHEKEIVVGSVKKQSIGFDTNGSMVDGLNKF